MGPRQQLIIAGGASVAPSNTLAAVLAEAHQRNFVGGIVGAVGGGSPSMAWVGGGIKQQSRRVGKRKTMGTMRWKRPRGWGGQDNITTNHQRER